MAKAEMFDYWEVNPEDQKNHLGNLDIHDHFQVD